MSIQYTIKATVTTESESGCVRLFHGTHSSHVGSLVQGIEFTKGGDGYFWATPDHWNAWRHAEMAEQQMMFADLPPGRQAILAFDLPTKVLDMFQGQEPEPWLVVYLHGYRFSQACSEVLHSEIRNVEITFEQ